MISSTNVLISEMSSLSIGLSKLALIVSTSNSKSTIFSTISVAVMIIGFGVFGFNVFLVVVIVVFSVVVDVDVVVVVVVVFIVASVVRCVIHCCVVDRVVLLNQLGTRVTGWLVNEGLDVVTDWPFLQ